MINLLLANSCGLNCSYCYQKKRHDEKFMSLDFVIKEFGNPGNTETIHLFGGEPFRNKEVIEWFSKNRNNKYKITTNVLELDLEILKNFLQTTKLKHLKLSLDPIGTNNRYNSKTELKILNKTFEIINLFKNYQFGELELHFVFLKKDYLKAFENYKYFINKLIKIKYLPKITYSLDTNEIKNNNELDILMFEYEKIIDYDLENFNVILFKSLIPQEFNFCDGKQHITYNIEKKLIGCPRMIYENKNEKIKDKCLKCKNEFCYSCILSDEKDCDYFNKIKKLINKKVYKC